MSPSSSSLDDENDGEAIQSGNTIQGEDDMAIYVLEVSYTTTSSLQC